MAGAMVALSIGFLTFVHLALPAVAEQQGRFDMPPENQAEDSAAWADATLALREQIAQQPGPRNERRNNSPWQRALELEHRFPVHWDWMLQDAGAELDQWFVGGDAPLAFLRRMAEQAWAEAVRLGAPSPEGTGILAPQTGDRDLLLAWATARRHIRDQRLATLIATWPKIVFARHYPMGGSHYAYTEGLSDAQHERHFQPGSSLCLLEMDGSFGVVRRLIDDPDGVIRDPDTSYDGRRILFSWKKSLDHDDYSLYDYDVQTGAVRRLTGDLGHADYEGVYLPGGGILFNSTRCVQIVDCWWTEVSNLYVCDEDGQNMRRLTFDQVHTNYPTVTHDGRILYTRWEYNDRGQLFPQPLFQMNADGTNQREYYGNSSWFPTTIIHARSIPNSIRVMAIATGHHTLQVGKPILIDPSLGRQEASGITMLAPREPAEAVRVDVWGQDGPQSKYPYPLSEEEFIISHDPLSGQRPQRFRLYWMDADGRREALASLPDGDANRPVPLGPRPRPHVMPTQVDYAQSTGSFYVQDVYEGPGLEGVERGKVKSLRVVEIRYRAAGIGSNSNNGPAGGALVSTPIAIGNGAWDVKAVLGEAQVFADGSAFFEVPARTPVYFQALDEKGHALQTMRSWSTLQPGEAQSCVGCHEDKNSAPPKAKGATLALAAGAERLRSEPDVPAEGFSFITHVQPILDRHCIECHTNRSFLNPLFPGADHPDNGEPVSLLSAQTADGNAKVRWSDSYLALTNAERHGGVLYGQPNAMVNWVHSQSEPPMMAPRETGATRSRLVSLLERGHKRTRLTAEELRTIVCWIDLGVPYTGDYTEARQWTEDEVAMYEHFLAKRRAVEETEQQVLARFAEGGELTSH